MASFFSFLFSIGITLGLKLENVMGEGGGGVGLLDMGHGTYHSLYFFIAFFFFFFFFLLHSVLLPGVFLRIVWKKISVLK